MKQNAASAILVTLLSFAFGLGCTEEETRKGRSGNQLDVNWDLINKKPQLGLSQPEITYAGAIRGCLSQYSKEFTHENTQMKVWEGDRNCRVELDVIAINGVAFYPPTNADWSIDSSIIFTSPDSDDVLGLTIHDQLGSPITPDACGVILTFKLQNVTDGETQTARGSLETALQIDLNQNPLPLNIVEKGLTIGDQGQGVFNFSFMCDATIADQGQGFQCGDYIIDDIHYGLAWDNFASGLDIEQCRDIALNSGYTAVASWNSANGGFDSEPLESAGSLYSKTHTNFVLALASAGRAGCKYFKVVVTGN